MTRIARLVLGAILSLSAAFLGFFSILGMVVLGVPDPPIRILGVASMCLGGTVAGYISPLLVPSARLFPQWRRGLAGIGGVAVGVLVAQVLRHLGVDSADRDYSMGGLIQKMAAMTVFYVSMVVGAAACLGSVRPPRP